MRPALGRRGRRSGASPSAPFTLPHSRDLPARWAHFTEDRSKTACPRSSGRKLRAQAHRPRSFTPQPCPAGDTPAPGPGRGPPAQLPAHTGARYLPGQAPEGPSVVGGLMPCVLGSGGLGSLCLCPAAAAQSTTNRCLKTAGSHVSGFRKLEILMGAGLCSLGNP